MNPFWIDIALACAIVVFFAAGYLGRAHAPDYLALFALGCAIGATWEIAFVFLGPAYRPDDPLYIFLTPFPLPLVFQPVVHSVWDGAIFMVGVALIDRLVSGPNLRRFRSVEVAILLAWGSLQELLVELLATGAGLWTYRVTEWNPALFAFGPGHITLLPHLIWLAAPIVYYPLAIFVRRRVLRDDASVPAES